MIDRKELNEIFDQIRPLREEKRIEGQYPSSVLFVKQKIKDSNDPDKILTLRELLRAEYIIHDMDDEHEALLRENVEINQDSFEKALSLITLAKYLADSGKEEEAISLMHEAIERAKNCDYLGYCYNEYARFAVMLRNFTMLNEILNFLINYDMEKDSTLFAYDTSFLEGIPKDAIDQDLLHVYLEKTKKFNQKRRDFILAKKAEREAQEDPLIEGE